MSDVNDNLIQRMLDLIARVETTTGVTPTTIRFGLNSYASFFAAIDRPGSPPLGRIHLLETIIYDDPRFPADHVVVDAGNAELDDLTRAPAWRVGRAENEAIAARTRA